MQALTERQSRRRAALPAVALAALLALPASAQLSVRPEDPTGLSIREERVRVVHADEPSTPGTSMHLQMTDPWMAYQRGRSLYFREWASADHVFEKLPTPIRAQSAATNSCGICHNLPFPSAGAGGNIVSDVGMGLNTPHLFGAGLLETLSMQVRSQLLHRYDTNRNGYLDHPSETQGRRAVVEAMPGVEVDFGSFDDENGDGMPDLNPVMLNRMVTDEGVRSVFTADGSRMALVSDDNIVGYDFAVGVFASHAGDHMFPALRMFSSGVLANIMGILPEDGPIEKNARMGYLIKNWGKISNAGAFMTELFLTHDPFVEPDPTARPTISVGELDLFEWFLTNYPRPTLAPQTAETRRGRKLMDQMQCTSCHVADWEILPQDEEMGLPGDRRFFDLAVAHDPIDQRYEGTLVRLSETKTLADGTQVEVPKRGGFVVRDVFTDLQHHDLGPKFRHYTYRNERVSYASQFFRTPPLWGVAATPPYGHDGRSLTLDDVIRRHGGEAEESTQAYVTAPVEDREAVLAFLRTLQLYIPETLPTDLDGDGKISDHYMVAGRDLGPEVFRAELLFANSPIYRGWVGEGDARFYSYEMLNVAEAYGTNLKALRDSDGDTLPDLLEKDAPKVGFVPQRSSNATTSGPSLPAAAAAHDTP